jgi:hypothetical protein
MRAKQTERAESVSGEGPPVRGSPTCRDGPRSSVAS